MHTAADPAAGYAQAQQAGDSDRRQTPPPSATALAAQPARPYRHSPLSALRTDATPTTSTAALTASTSTTSSPSALVLYDSTGPYASLGEVNAIGVANLAGHFGTVTTEPISSYVAGQLQSYTAAIYVGTSYYGTASGAVPNAIPIAFSQDVAAGTRPVIWAYDNIWELSNQVGSAAIAAEYGWDPSTSYFNNDKSTSVAYKGQILGRSALNVGGILAPTITDAAKVQVLATAHDDVTGNPIPWAIRSGNLTYVGDQPFAYVDESDRTMIFADLLFDAMAPSTLSRHRALVRLEDLSPKSDPSQLKSVADFLYGQHIPFSFNVTPVYTDPLGYYNNGTPQTIKLSQAPNVVNALKYLISHGGTMVMEGYTHQYSNIKNPYSGVTGDDFEFYLSHVNSANDVVLDGPVGEDSSSWATNRINSGFKEFSAVKLPKPNYLVVPHYAGSKADYQAFLPMFKARYDRTLYFGGQLTGAAPDYSVVFGQYFPYLVKDVYGQTVIPENLGDYEPTVLNNHPVRLPADIAHEAQLNEVVRDGFASFFYDPSNGVDPLKQTVADIQALNAYTFVGAPSLVP
ncbi:MAG: polysaccharide deacetylase family protein [Mycobacteriales bacterium]